MRETEVISMVGQQSVEFASHKYSSQQIDFEQQNYVTLQVLVTQLRPRFKTLDATCISITKFRINERTIVLTWNQSTSKQTSADRC